jgi:hypothetical protein
MAAVSLAVIGKNNEPLYIREFNASDDTSRSSLSPPSVVVGHVDDDAALFGLTSASMSLSTSSTSSSSSLPPTIGTPKCSLRQQFILHAALDRFDQVLAGGGQPNGHAWRASNAAVGTDAMWVGLLCPVEDLRIYGTIICLIYFVVVDICRSCKHT